MDKIWVIPICLVIIGWFGIFWTLNLSNIEFDINMDENTLDALKSLDRESINNLDKEATCFIPLNVLNSNVSYKMIMKSNGECVFEESAVSTGSEGSK